MLLQIKSYFNEIGNIYIVNNNVITYQIRTVSEIIRIRIIIPHIEKYPLISQKLNDYIIFNIKIELIDKNEHLCKDGFMKIVGLIASFKNGLSNKLNIYFSGEGCFFINICKATDCKITNNI